MVTYIITSIASGILFGVMDALINANPLARRLNEIYKPIAKTSLNAPVGIVIDIVYGFAMAGIFLLLFEALPGESGLLKGLSFTVFAWFFRVVMSVISSWMMYKVPVGTLIYTLITGLGEMLVLGILYGLVLKP